VGIFLGASMEDNVNLYQPNRILVLILEELNEDIINSPMTSLLTLNTNVINIVSEICFLIYQFFT